jgi:hypothetical protein
LLSILWCCDVTMLMFRSKHEDEMKRVVDALELSRHSSKSGR